jgi:HAD superfamily hydrolase (TIGR01490 family)
MDRTLVRRETASLYVRYQRDIGEAGWRDSLQVAWWVLQYTVGVIDAERVAERAVAGYAGRSEQHMIDSCRDWFRRYVLEHVSDVGRRTVARHRDAGHVTAIVTGATRYAAQPLAEELGIEHVVCTDLEVIDGSLTGRVVKPMCFGAGKIDLARRCGDRVGFSLDDAVFYSDSITDLPLLERVRRPVVVNPDARLKRVAARRGWAMEHW